MSARQFQFSYRIVYLDANFRFYRTCTVKDSVLGIADPDIQLAELTAITRFGRICHGPALALGTHRWCRLVSVTRNPLLDAGKVGDGHLLGGAAFTPIRDQSVNARLREASLGGESSRNECHDSQFQPLLVALILRGAGTTVRVPTDITFPNTRNGDALSMSDAFISISRTVTAADLFQRKNDNDNTRKKKCKNSKST